MCGVCERIQEILDGRNPFFVRELETGFVVIGDYQRIKGYTLFLCKECVPEIHLLEKNFRAKFLQEMSLVAEAVYAAFQPQKLNYELLGVGDNIHMHWHIFPRNEGDTPEPGPVWRLSSKELYHSKYRPSDHELAAMKAQLNAELNKLLLPD